MYLKQFCFVFHVVCKICRGHAFRKLHLLSVCVPGIGEVCLQNPPVNTLNSDMLTRLVEGVNTLEKDGCRALLLTSVGGCWFRALEIFHQR